MMLEDKKSQMTISISTNTIIKFILILLSLGLIYMLKDVLMILLVSAVLASALNPWVNALQKRKVPRVLATVFIYLAFFGSFILIFVLMIPPIATQVGDIASNFPDYYNRVVNDFQNFREFSLQQNLLESLSSTLDSLQDNISQTASGVLGAVASIFGGIFSLLGVFVITFYMLLEEHAMKKFIRSLTPSKYQPYIFQLMNRSQDKLRLWLKGQLILSFIIFLLAYIGLTVLGVKYALVLALWAGLTEFIPYLGPLLGAIPAVFISMTTGGFMITLIVIIWYIVIQQLENSILVPKVMQKTVGMNPLVVIIVMLIGAKLAGIVGILLAVPLTLIIKAFAEDFMANKEEAEFKLEE